MNTVLQQTEKVQQVLKYTYSLVPIIAGADKFMNMLTNWENYLSPSMIKILPFSGAVFMSIVGLIEIAAGVLVIFRPRIGGYVVMAWLTVIALTLIPQGQYFDVAVRDLVMAAGAYSLATLSTVSFLQKKQFTQG